MTILLTLILATWRLTTMLVNETGPFKVFKNLRDAVGVGLEDDVGDPLTFLGGLLSCTWCTSVWIAAGLVFVAAPLIPALCISWAGIVYYMLTVFAVSGGAILADTVVTWVTQEG